MRSSIHYTLAAALTLSLGIVCADAQAQQTPAKTQPAGGSKPSGPASGITVRTYVDRTALWVGDQFHYQIFVDHSPDIQFILENVNAETITLDPLRVVDVAFSTVPLKNGNERLFMDLTLAHLTPGLMEVKIPQLTLFYFRREGAAAPTTSEGAAAEGFTIEGPVISVRSTLPRGQADLRDAVTVTGWPRSRWIAAGIGWFALVLLVGGAAWESARIFRRRGRQGPDPRKTMAAIRDRWSESVPADFNDANVVMAFYARSYRDLKEYLGYLLETHTEGLTADELRAEMTRRVASPDLIDRAATVAEVCENARYAPIGAAAVTGTAADAVADNMREIFKAGLRR